MGLFICDKCDVIENTACGAFWGMKADYIKKEYRGKALCSQCIPQDLFGGAELPRKYKNGWHGKWDRLVMTEDLVKERLKVSEDYFTYMGRFEYLRPKEGDTNEESKKQVSVRGISKQERKTP